MRKPVALISASIVIISCCTRSTSVSWKTMPSPRPTSTTPNSGIGAITIVVSGWSSRVNSPWPVTRLDRIGTRPAHCTAGADGVRVRLWAKPDSNPTAQSASSSRGAASVRIASARSGSFATAWTTVSSGRCSFVMPARRTPRTVNVPARRSAATNASTLDRSPSSKNWSTASDILPPRTSMARISMAYDAITLVSCARAPGRSGSATRNVNSTRVASLVAIYFDRAHVAPVTTRSRSRDKRSPGRGGVVLQEAVVEVDALFAAHDRVVHPGRTIDEVERSVEALGRQPGLRRVRPLVGNPAGVDTGHQDAVAEQVARAGSREHVHRRLGHIRVRVAGALVDAAELAFHRRHVHHVLAPRRR